MKQQTITISGDQAVSIAILSRPHCLDIEGKHDLLKMVRSLSEQENLRVLIIAASDPEAWLVNVEELVEMSPDQARAFSRAGHQLADALASLPAPVIAAVDGAALGGGCELVLACDLAIAGASAQFGQIEAMGGVIPAFGGTWRLARRVGNQRAMRMLLTAEVVDAETAKTIGLVLDTVPSAQLHDQARALGSTDSKSQSPIRRRN